jgi:hypothetical protein
MKNFTKVKASLITFAVIAALAAISCAPPEVDVSGYDWKTANERNDASKSDAPIDLDFTVIGDSQAAAKNPQITIAFPPESDFLRSGNIESGLKEFLTVYNFKALGASDDGKSNELTSVDYALVNRADSYVTIRVNKDYTAAGTGAYSDLVVKIDGTKYKHSNGLFYDGDQNGKAGEAGYDDVYLTQDVTGSTIGGFAEPGNKTWYVNITGGPSPAFATETAATVSVPVAPVADILLGGISTTTTGGKAIYKEVADLVVGGISIEKLGANGVWTAESAQAVYDPASYVDKIVFKNLTLSHGAVYRVTYKGSGNLTSSSEYFGVKQRIFVFPDVNLNDGDVFGTPDVSGYSIKAIYALTQVSSRAVVVNNDDLKEYITTKDFTVTRLSHALDDTNNVFQLKINNLRGDPAVGLDSAVIGDLTKFKASFKVVLIRTESDKDENENAINSVESITYIDIKDVKGIPTTGGTAIDTLRITIDPAFKYDTPKNDTWVPTPGFNRQWVYVNGNNPNNYPDYYPWGWYYQASNSTTPTYIDGQYPNWSGSYLTASGKWVTETYYLLINDGLGYTGGKFVYGNPDNYGNGNFELYESGL